MAISPRRAPARRNWRPRRTHGTPPAWPHRPVRRGLVAAVLVVVGLLVAGAVIAGWMARDAAAPEPAVTPAQVQATAGPVTIVAPGDWKTESRVPGIDNLDPARTKALAPTPGLVEMVGDATPQRGKTPRPRDGALD